MWHSRFPARLSRVSSGSVLPNLILEIVDPWLIDLSSVGSFAEDGPVSGPGTSELVL